MQLFPSLTLEEGWALIAAGVDESKRMGVAQNLAVVDAFGHLLCFVRMDGANRLAAEIAVNKAVTAAATGVATDIIAPRTIPGEPGYMIQTQCAGRFTTIGGGAPVLCDGATLGALGVSGGSVAQDVEIAAAVVLAFQPENCPARE